MFVPIGHLSQLTYDHILLQIRGHDIVVQILRSTFFCQCFFSLFWRLYIWRLQQHGKTAWIKRQHWKFRIFLEIGYGRETEKSDGTVSQQSICTALSLCPFLGGPVLWPCLHRKMVSQTLNPSNIRCVYWHKKTKQSGVPTKQSCSIVTERRSVSRFQILLEKIHIQKDSQINPPP